MNLIHIADSQGRRASYDVQEAHRLWREGSIARDSLYWREGMLDWRSAAEFFSVAPVQEVGDRPPTLSEQSRRGFVKDPARLTRFLIWLLWIYLGVAALSGLISVMGLVTGQATNVDTENLNAFDVASLIVGLPRVVVVIVTGIVFLMWIHRANRNARGLGAEGMTFTPGWSVGWYFVPILNLWKPYQAMKEIWQASADPSLWRSQKPPSLVANWWALWIFSNVIANVSFRMSLWADTGNEMVVSTVVTLISELIDIPLCVIAIRMVREIVRLQNHWAGQPAQSACGICRQPATAAEMVFLNQTWVCAHCKPVALQQLQEGATNA